MKVKNDELFLMSEGGHEEALPIPGEYFTIAICDNGRWGIYQKMDDLIRECSGPIGEIA